VSILWVVRVFICSYLRFRLILDFGHRTSDFPRYLQKTSWQFKSRTI